MEECKIKFRVWNSEFKEFKVWGFVKNYFIGPPMGSGLSVEECKNGSQQFTGLYDKNGKEVFGGDVVKYFGWEVRAGKQIRPERFIIVGDRKGWVSDCYAIRNLSLSGSIEVVGNIHENPKLIEVDNG